MFARPAKPRRTQVRIMYCGLALVALFFLYALAAAAWTHFEMWKVTPW